jgi:hypothetical protein
VATIGWVSNGFSIRGQCVDVLPVLGRVSPLHHERLFLLNLYKPTKVKSAILKPVIPPGFRVIISPSRLITFSILLSLYDAAISPSAKSKVAIRVGDLRLSDLLILISLSYILINWKNESKTIHPHAKKLFKIILFASCFSFILGILLDATFDEIYSNTRGLITLSVGTTYRFEKKNLKLLSLFSFFAGLILISYRLPIGVDFATIITVIAGINFTFSRNSQKSTLILKYMLAGEAIVISFMVDQRAQFFFLFLSLIIVILLSLKSSTQLGVRSYSDILVRGIFFGLLLMSACTILLLFPATRLYLQGILADQIINSNSEIGNRLSLESRISQFGIGMEALKSSWFYGHGPGFSYLFQEPGNKMQITYITHNILLDTSLRVGVPLTLLLFISIWWTLARAYLRKSGDFQIKLGAYIFFIGLFSKGFFESILDKPRVYVVFGICLGLALNSIKESEHPTSPRMESI